MTTRRERQRALARFARAHNAIAANRDARLAAAKELREMGVTFKEIGAAVDPPMTPEGVKQLVDRGSR